MISDMEFQNEGNPHFPWIKQQSHSEASVSELGPVWMTLADALVGMSLWCWLVLQPPFIHEPQTFHSSPSALWDLDLNRTVSETCSCPRRSWLLATRVHISWVRLLAGDWTGEKQKWLSPWSQQFCFFFYFVGFCCEIVGRCYIKLYSAKNVELTNSVFGRVLFKTRQDNFKTHR